MAKVVNLGKVRKARARDAKRQQADANAAKFGRTKAEKERDAARVDRDNRHLDGHARDNPDDGA